MAEHTYMADLIDPEVLADMISAKVEDRVMALPYAKLDTTLQGRPGTTITVPRYGYTFGTAVEVPEGEAIPLCSLETDTVEYTVKKIGNGGGITDEALLSGYGNPMGEIVSQLAISMSNKMDADTIDELYKASVFYNGGKPVGYDPIVEAIDLFEEEINTPKVMFVHPKQVTQLRKDPDFLSADKYQSGVRINGEVGKICNTHVIPSRKVRLVEFEKNSSGNIDITEGNLAQYQAKVDPATTLAAGDKVKELSAAAKYYVNPILKMSTDPVTEDETPAITMFVKRETNVETERKVRNRKTEITADKHYVVALTNEAKVVLAKHLAQGTVAAG